MLFTQKLFNLSDFKKELKNTFFQKAKTKLFSNIKSKSYGFMNDLYEKKINDIYFYAKKIKKSENVIFLGTGGSSLGGKTLVSINSNFFKNKNKPQIFFLENIDEVSINGLLDQLNMDKTSIVIISKAGETMETLAQFFLIKKKISKTKNYKKRIFVITEKKKVLLKKFKKRRTIFL